MSDLNDYIQQKEQIKAIKQARVRVGVSWLCHLFIPLPPVTSLIYSIKSENFLPFLAATGVAVAAAPVALVDFGFTFFVAPPVTSAVLLTTRANKRRRELGIFGPEMADGMLYNVAPKVEVTVKNEVPV